MAYDYILDDGQYLYFPVVNYTTGDHEVIREMLNDSACLLGLSDGGAHCTSIIESASASMTPRRLASRSSSTICSRSRGSLLRPWVSRRSQRPVVLVP